MNIQRGWGLSGSDVPKKDRRGYIVLVGECPAPGWEGRPEHILTGEAFSGNQGAPGRIARLAGLNFRQYFETFDRVNVYERRAAKWTNLHSHRAESQAARIVEVAEGRPVILLGRRVMTAFGFPSNMEFLRRHGIFRTFPHPSGRNHWWNNEVHRISAARFLRSVVSEAKEARRHGVH